MNRNLIHGRLVTVMPGLPFGRLVNVLCFYNSWQMERNSFVLQVDFETVTNLREGQKVVPVLLEKSDKFIHNVRLF